ncbi:hypothetical protein SAMN06296952_1207 [Oscillospiraceae bacterium]|nr:hypothetical protein SAMN06296952_1207 [Oscillospiraceae bacterium]
MSNDYAIITAKINAIDDLYDTIQNYRNSEVLGVTSSIEEVSNTSYYFSISNGGCVEDIIYQCARGSSDTIYSKLNEYYDALGDAMDQINRDKSSLRAQRRGNGLIDNAVSTLDGLITGIINLNN